MSKIIPDPIMGRPAELAEGERLVAEFRPDLQVYWRSHLVMAVLFGVAAGLLLMWLQNPYPVVGPVGAVLAIAARAAYVRSEAMAEVWRLTDRRLLGPQSRAIPLAQLVTARAFLGAVQVTTATGDRHLIKYQADPQAVAGRLTSAAGRRGRSP